MGKEICEHLEKLIPKGSKKDYCEACIKTNDKWNHLRVCQSCGVVLCCDASKNQHASKHFKKTGHPVVISNLPKPWSKFAWCYQHKLKKNLKQTS